TIKGPKVIITGLGPGETGASATGGIAAPRKRSAFLRSLMPPARRLLHILNQLAHLLERVLDRHDILGNADVARLRANGIGLAEHFLHEKLKLAPRAVLFL